MNHYDANGRKYKSIIYTNVDPGMSYYDDIAHYTFDMDSVWWKVTEYNGNIETYYTPEDTTYRVYNSIGYYDSKTNAYYHYVKDHLGNISAVVNSQADTMIQSTIYYASGVPMMESKGIPYRYYNAYGAQPNQNFGRDEQPYLYNGKEFIEAHGLNEYDSQARMYYATIMRTTTMDPLAEDYYHLSPYSWCANDPINKFDPDGRADYYAADGHHLCNDGVDDKKVYQQQNNVRETNTYLLPGVEGVEKTTASQNEDVVLGGYATPFSYVGDVDNISLSYDGAMISDSKSKGTLTVTQYVGDKQFSRGFSAISGNGSTKKGNAFYTLQNGDYICYDYIPNVSKEGYVKDGVGFLIQLSTDASWTTQRDGLQIHPDQYPPGTKGCIGLTGTASELSLFQKMVSPFTSGGNTSPLSVSIKGNPQCCRAVDTKKGWFVPLFSK